MGLVANLLVTPARTLLSAARRWVFANCRRCTCRQSPLNKTNINRGKKKLEPESDDQKKRGVCALYALETKELETVSRVCIRKTESEQSTSLFSYYNQLTVPLRVQNPKDEKGTSEECHKTGWICFFP